jgi:hypothetical protein
LFIKIGEESGSCDYGSCDYGSCDYGSCDYDNGATAMTAEE